MKLSSTVRRSGCAYETSLYLTIASQSLFTSTVIVCVLVIDSRPQALMAKSQILTANNSQPHNYEYNVLFSLLSISLHLYCRYFRCTQILFLQYLRQLVENIEKLQRNDDSEIKFHICNVQDIGKALWSVKFAESQYYIFFFLGKRFFLVDVYHNDAYYVLLDSS